jgi:uncharacterized protein (TIGR04255 family)
MSDNSTPKYDRPPVVEVACGVLFNTPSPLRSAHIGLYWKTVRGDFPRIEEAPPLDPVIETQGVMGVMQFGFGPLPPLRRTWLVSSDGRSLIQVQEDRFLFNWKKAEGADKYPSYQQVIARFDKHLSGFVGFLHEAGVGSPIYRQFELTYFNHIGLEKTGSGIDVSENTVLVDHVRDSVRDRFLPEPELVNWVTVYPLPNQEGRLYATAQSARSPDGARIMRLEMTARGIPNELSEVGRRNWFDQAHTWITKGFADLTDAEVQARVWERTA